MCNVSIQISLSSLPFSTTEIIKPKPKLP